MFDVRGDVPESTLRNTSGVFAGFGKAMDKYPPVYWSDILNTHLWAALSG
jgi:hypothetical protein